MAQLSPSPVLHDLVVAGPSATGGWAAKELSETGMKVALSEAGAKVTPNIARPPAYPARLHTSADLLSAAVSTIVPMRTRRSTPLLAP